MLTLRWVVGATAIIGLAGCERPSTAPSHAVTPRHAGALRNSMAGDPFFTAWAWDDIARVYPIVTQPYNAGPDPVSILAPDLYRQVWILITNLPPGLGQWAHDHPGKRWSASEEMDGGNRPDYTNNPEQYATDYCAFINAVKGATNGGVGDPTATFGPGGFATLNTDWFNRFIDAYESGGCSSVPIAEWTFHTGAAWNNGNPLPELQTNVNARLGWSMYNNRYGGQLAEWQTGTHNTSPG